MLKCNQLKVFLIAKDFGARPAYLFSVLHKERVQGVVTMGVPLLPPNPPKYHELLPKGFYITRWKVSLEFTIIIMYLLIEAKKSAVR